MSDDPSLENHLRELEESLLDPKVRKDPVRVSALMADDFLEYASSGRVYDKAQIIEEMLHEPPIHLGLTEYRVTPLADGIALARYIGLRYFDPPSPAAAGAEETPPPRRSLRSSLWRREDGRWRLFFHQGTTIPAVP